MANTDAGHVDIVSRESGKPLAQIPSGSSQVITLSQPSLVKIQGNRAMVASYQQQNDDLILHMQDGTTVHYQHFFTAVDGEQSELVFVDGENPPEQALFATPLQTDPQALTNVTPSYQSLESVDQLTLADATATSSSTASAVGLGLLGLVGAGVGVAAASGGGGGSDGGSTQSSTTPATGNAPGTSTPPATAPVLVVDSFTEDGVVSAEEKNAPQILSGTLQSVAAGSTVTVVLNGKTYTTALAENGTWQVTVPESDLQALPVGVNKLAVSFPNNAGGTTTASKSITVEASPVPEESTPPHPTINTPSGDGWINETEYHQTQTFSGTTGVTGAGQQVKVTIGSMTFAAVVSETGEWTLDIPSQTFITHFGQSEHDITVVATDVSGQTGSTTSQVTVDSIPPSLTINDISGDNIVDVSEAASPVVINGRAEANSALVVTLAGKDYEVTANASGDWTMTLPVETVQSLPLGDNDITVTTQDTAGNETSTSTTLQVYTQDTLPTLTIDVVSEDDAVNYDEGIYGVDFYGDATGIPDGSTIELTLNGKTWQGIVSNNSWWVSIDDNDLQAIPDGKYTYSVSASDLNGNSTSASRDLLLITHYRGSSPTLVTEEVTLDDMKIINGREYYTLSGTMSGEFPITLMSIKGDDESSHVVTMDGNGHWHVDLPWSAFSQSTGYTQMIVGTRDEAGNWFEKLTQVKSDFDTPVSTLSLMAADESAFTVNDNPTDALNGTDGDDTFTVTADSHGVVNGGAGHDTLLVGGHDTTLDLAALGLNVTNVEVLDLGTSGTNGAVLDQKAVMALEENASDDVIIKGADGSNVTLSNTDGGVWQEIGQRTLDGEQYDHYQSASADGQNTLADVLIQHNLHVQTV